MPRGRSDTLRTRAAPGRARPALGPVCDQVAALGQAGMGNTHALAASQEVRLEMNGGVGSPPEEPRRNADRRAHPKQMGLRRLRKLVCGARRARKARRLDYTSAGVLPPFLFAVCSPGGAQRNPGTMKKLQTPVPDCASLHPGYGYCKPRARIASRE